ncbi:MAG: ABC transporter substrate-binding protein [Acidimicrobiales bacterium]
MSVLVLLTLLVGVTACSNSKSKNTSTKGGKGATCTSPNETQGVSDTEIRVGGVASHTNPLGFDYGEAFAGTAAYFQMVNEKGGVNGRKLNLVAKEDDQVGSNTQSVQRLISGDNVFAVAPVASLLFTGAPLLAQNCIPTYGWNINPEWASGPSLFGDKGSNLKFTAANQGLAWLTQKLGKKKVAVLAYPIPESKQCATGIENTYKQYPIANVAFTDSALAYPLSDVSGDVAKMKAAGVDLVAACVDVEGMGSIAREMHKQGLNATMYLPDGYYDQIKTDPNFQGAYAQTFFTPFETPNPPQGLNEYLSWMKKTNGPVSEISLAGWVAADMFVTALKAAGKDVTRSKVVAALNKVTSYDADGILPGIDWTIAHTPEWNPPCAALSEVDNGSFVPKFGQPGKPFLCFPTQAKPGAVPEPTFKS